MSSHQHKPTGMKQSNRRFKGKSKGRQHRLASSSSSSSSSAAASSVARHQPRSAATEGHKARRQNRTKQLQSEHRRRLVEARRTGAGSARGPPKMVALVALSPLADLGALRSGMVAHCARTGGGVLEGDPLLRQNRNPAVSTCAAVVEKRAVRFTFYECARDTDAVLDAAKAADQVVLVVAPGADGSDADPGVDALGFHLLSVLVAQGLPHAVGVVQGQDRVRDKKRHAYRHLAQRVFESYAAGQVGHVVAFGADGAGEDEADAMRMVFRWIGQPRAESIEWRANRAYLAAETAAFLPESGAVVVSGFVRGGRRLPSGALVHVTGHGDFRVARVARLPDPSVLEAKASAKASSAVAAAAAAAAAAPPVPLAALPAVPGGDTAPPAPDATECLLPEDPFAVNAFDQSVVNDEEIEMAQAHRREAAQRKANLDRQAAAKAGGASDIQAVWDAIGDDDDDDDDEDDARSEYPASEYGDLAMPADVDEEAGGMDPEVALRERERLARDEMDFPDEVETPLDVDARERFARYRGLKSLRSTPWHPYEALPVEYGRICSFENYDRTRRRVTAAPAAGEGEGEGGGAAAGDHVFVFLEAVPEAKARAMCDPSRPLLLWALLEYERKVSVLHFSVRRHNDDVEDPVRGKDPVVFHCGFRRFRGRPVYSDAVVNADKHLVERFLLPRRHSVATVYGHIQFPPAPVLMFRATPPRSSPGPFNPLMADGQLLSVDPNRVLVKRIVLSGYPISARKRHAVVRYMFFSAEDVRWFKPVQLHTKDGLVGHIREPRGTKGYMKCVFDNHIKQSDTVLMSLYKRQFPKWDPSLFGSDQLAYDAAVVAPGAGAGGAAGAAVGDVAADGAADADEAGAGGDLVMS